jgi:hypothetical protein
MGAMIAAVTFLCLAAPSSSRSATSERKPVDVYLIGGQSNATGQGYMANLPQGVKPDQRVMLFHSSGHLKSGAEPNTWIPLRQASESPDRFGPELGFGNRLQQLQPDRKIAIIKHEVPRRPRPLRHGRNVGTRPPHGGEDERQAGRRAMTKSREPQS